MGNEQKGEVAFFFLVCVAGASVAPKPWVLKEEGCSHSDAPESSAAAQARGREWLIVAREETADHPAPNHLTVLRVYPCLPEPAN